MIVADVLESILALLPCIHSLPASQIWSVPQPISLPILPVLKLAQLLTALLQGTCNGGIITHAACVMKEVQLRLGRQISGCV